MDNETLEIGLYVILIFDLQLICLVTQSAVRTVSIYVHLQPGIAMFLCFCKVSAKSEVNKMLTLTYLANINSTGAQRGKNYSADNRGFYSSKQTATETLFTIMSKKSDGKNNNIQLL